MVHVCGHRRRSRIYGWGVGFHTGGGLVGRSRGGNEAKSVREKCPRAQFRTSRSGGSRAVNSAAQIGSPAQRCSSGYGKRAVGSSAQRCSSGYGKRAADEGGDTEVGAPAAAGVRVPRVCTRRRPHRHQPIQPVLLLPGAGRRSRRAAVDPGAVLARKAGRRARVFTYQYMPR